MPGITMLGDSRNATRSRPTSLPAEARSVSRMLRLVGSSEAASQALLDSLNALPSKKSSRLDLDQVKQHLLESIQDMRTSGWESFSNRYAEYSMALAVETAVQQANLGSHHQNKTLTQGDDDLSLPKPTKTRMTKKDPPTTTLLTTQPTTTLQTTTAVIVSDTSSVEASSSTVEDDDDELDNEMDTDELSRALAIKHFWAALLESLHLQLASRTTRVWGKKKIYEIYEFARPVVPDQQLMTLETLRPCLERECRSVFRHLMGEDTEFRVYLIVLPSKTFIQISIGKFMDLQDERNRSVSGEKKKKAGKEFVAHITPGSTLFALTASRSPSRSRYTPYILTALENALTATTTCVVGNTFREETGLAVKRVGDLAGTEPSELLRAARAMQGEAVGRYAHHANQDRSNPVSDLHQAATGSLLDRSADKARIDIGTTHNSSVAKVAQRIDKASNGTAALVAINQNGLIVDRSVQQRQNRKRARDEEFGKTNDCPRLQRLCWRWTGETAAPAMCLHDTDKKEETVPKKTLFKCGLVMQGTNVFEGLRALVESGYAKTPLPDFLREAPLMGGTIRVNHGTFTSAESSFESV